MTRHETELSAAYAPLRQALAELRAPDALEAQLLASYRQAYAPAPKLHARLLEWLRQERNLWLPLGGACVAALAAMLWLRPLLLQRGPLAPSTIEAAAQQTTGEELATAFFPVGDPARIQAADHARMVRVTMPRAALVSYGLPVNPALADQPIEADILVADDGSTLALRFVRGNHHLM
ncbi:hypothetical protein [Chitinimonas sp.]|uniref:hypothetical protein n=1 Tax=Chitinimonas sp. TaxID=1934313 RepID=UPI002F939F45